MTPVTYKTRCKFPRQVDDGSLDVPKRVEETFLCFVLLNVGCCERELPSAPVLI